MTGTNPVHSSGGQVMASRYRRLRGTDAGRNRDRLRARPLVPMINMRRPGRRTVVDLAGLLFMIQFGIVSLLDRTV